MNSPYLRTFVFGMFGVTAALVAAMFAVYGADTPGIFALLARRSSQLLTGSPTSAGWTLQGGFAINIAVSLVAMAIAIGLGALLGLGMMSRSKPARWASTIVMNVFRNSPWLVILYATLYLLPFEFTVGGHVFAFPPFAKAVVGLSIPVMANLAEIFHGSIHAIPATQWEAARSLGYTNLGILRRVVVPQAVPLMIPNVMNLYAMLFIGTSLIVVTGTDDVLAMAKLIAGTEGERAAAGIYIYILFMFFTYCFPIAFASRWLEHRVVEAQA